MLRLKWITLATGRRYAAETLPGIRVEIRMVREKGIDKGFVMYVANETHPTTVKNPERAKVRAEKLYCTIIRNEYRRVCE